MKVKIILIASIVSIRGTHTYTQDTGNLGLDLQLQDEREGRRQEYRREHELRMRAQKTNKSGHEYQCKRTTLAKKFETGTQAKHRRVHTRQIKRLCHMRAVVSFFFGRGSTIEYTTCSTSISGPQATFPRGELSAKRAAKNVIGFSRADRNHSSNSLASYFQSNKRKSKVVGRSLKKEEKTG